MATKKIDRAYPYFPSSVLIEERDQRRRREG